MEIIFNKIIIVIVEIRILGIIIVFIHYLGMNVATAPNEQQVFVGSLPLDFTKETLFECFSKFGTVLDVKIHTPTHDNKKVGECFKKVKPKTFSFLSIFNRILVLLYLIMLKLQRLLLTWNISCTMMLFV